MNYLGHAVLSLGDADVLTGNMIGDHVKGQLAIAAYPPGIQRGIRLHRKIDEFTDIHPAAMRAKIWLRPTYRLYAGAVLDTLLDHFLANDPKQFPSEKALLDFSERTYAQLESNAAHFPPAFAQYFPYMRTQNWLYGYRTMQGVQRSLGGLHRRAKYMPPPDDAYRVFVTHYYELSQCYYELIDDALDFVKVALTAG